MRLKHHAHLAYCTNVHPGKDWEQTFRSLQEDVLSVRRNLCPNDEYAIGLRLSASAAQELSRPATLANFKGWLEKENCYVFTINGFPYGDFHGQPVKERAYSPDWTTPERLAYTQQLFDILVQLVPQGVAGSVSTVPGSFKPFIQSDEQIQAINQNLYRLFEHIEKLSEKNDVDLHLGLEPEPLCLFETTPETLRFFDRLLDGQAQADRIRQRIGVNYDTCHLALQYESAPESLACYQANGIRLSKIHLSSALKVRDFSPATLDQLQTYCEPTYLHQVIAAPRPQKTAPQTQRKYLDLPEALAARRNGQDTADEWRIHFHIPLHAQPASPLLSTADHLLDTLDYVAANPALCQHFEMETYTWAVMPQQLHTPTVVEQITAEYRWLLPQLETRSLLPSS
ncbi:metabolite traffic protein EboE [Pelagicoccus sp. SDUM812005]|uniref:metabolite traffic protein EboE n=1 Tax=Pelagicoccus sp. SDUM812005 TaxID=3041257 RepID=UPI00280CBB98|nr:metabolite traffic protein EboE [Pelagicoccus sp. SDUM812005]MDQ8179996.1 metabolite traffic protein EboE [Pelagicoccus sp. SDUM812005]